MKRLWILLIVLVASTLGLIANSQDQNETPFDDLTFPVQVTVSSEDSINGLVSSYVKRELRSLRDVEIVYSNPGWELRIIAMETSTISGRKTGVVISTAIMKKFRNQILLDIMNTVISKEEFEKIKEIVSVLTSDLHDYRGSTLRVGSTDDLRTICNEIVADFDSDHLEAAREALKSLRK